MVLNKKNWTIRNYLLIPNSLYGTLVDIFSLGELNLKQVFDEFFF